MGYSGGISKSRKSGRVEKERGKRGKQKGQRGQESPISKFRTRFCLTLRVLYGSSAVWNPEGNPSSQGSVSANEVCCKVKAGLLPQIHKGVEGTPTFQESPNSDFLSR